MPPKNTGAPPKKARRRESVLSSSSSGSTSSRRRPEISPIRHLTQAHPFGCSAATYLMASQGMAPSPKPRSKKDTSCGLFEPPIIPQKGKVRMKALEAEIAKDASERKRINETPGGLAGKQYNLARGTMPLTSVAHTYDRGHYPVGEPFSEVGLKKLETKGHRGILQTNLYKGLSKKPVGKHVVHVRSSATPGQVTLHDPFTKGPQDFNVGDLTNPVGFKSGPYTQKPFDFSALRPTGSEFDRRGIARAAQAEAERKSRTTKTGATKRAVSPVSAGSYPDSYASDDEGLMRRGGLVKRRRK